MYNNNNNKNKNKNNKIYIFYFYLKQSYKYLIMNEAYDMNELNSMRDQIENMSKFNQLEILRILTKNKDVIINENKYGIHINLSDIDISILKELTLYIKYVQKQESFLNNTEEEKERYKNIFFVKDNKDNIQ